MASCQNVNCDNCDIEFWVWSDVHAYYWADDTKKKKMFVYHPSDKMDWVVGAEIEHLCLDCAREFRIDSEAPTKCCPRCKSLNISDMRELDGKPCPFCRKGHFVENPDVSAIS